MCVWNRLLIETELMIFRVEYTHNNESSMIYTNANIALCHYLYNLFEREIYFRVMIPPSRDHNAHQHAMLRLLAGRYGSRSHDVRISLTLI